MFDRNRARVGEVCMIVVKSEARQRWEARTDFSERHLPHAAGWKWDKFAKVWYAPTLDIAAKLSRFCPTALVRSQLAADLAAQQLERSTIVQASRATDADIDIPSPPGLAFRPFQKAGIARLVELPRALLADEQGLGKTPQIVGLANLAASRGETMRRILVVCPAFLRVNWSREVERWQTIGQPVNVWDGKGEPPADGWVIVGYEAATNAAPRLAPVAWDLVAFDEAHKLKSAKAQRTKAAIGGRGYARKARRVVFATGTPILNRPIELWPLLNFSGVLGMSWKDFVYRYCDARETRFGMDYTGASNLTELQERLRSTFMVRRLKADVLPELPPKRRSLVVLEATSADAVKALREEAAIRPRLASIEAALVAEASSARQSGDRDAYRDAVALLRTARVAAFTEMSGIRLRLGREKVAAGVELVRELFEVEDALIVFTVHREVAEAVHAAFPDIAVLAHGDVPPDQRQVAVDQIQAGRKRLFVGTIGAASTGLTITRAQTVLMLEQEWTPGTMEQAEDRAHRIGQTGSVDVKYLVVDGSLDADIARKLVAKGDVARSALDAPAATDPVALRDQELMKPVGRVANGNGRERGDYPSPYPLLDDIAPLPAARVELLRRMIGALASLDRDHAAMRNGEGFSRPDADMGHLLARLVGEGRRWSTWQEHKAANLVRRYQRQLVPTFGDAAVLTAIDKDRLAA